MAGRGLPWCSWAMELFPRVGGAGRLALQEWGASSVRAGWARESHGGGWLSTSGGASLPGWQVAFGVAHMG